VEADIKELKSLLRKLLREVYEDEDHKVEYEEIVALHKSSKFKDVYCIGCLLLGEDVFLDCTEYAEPGESFGTVH
jgi:hypothetical protein